MAASPVRDEGGEDHIVAFEHQFCARFDNFVRPTEVLLDAQPPNVSLLPLHLATIQEGFDLIMPFAEFLPAATYDQATRTLLWLRCRLEELQRDLPMHSPALQWQLSRNNQWTLLIDGDNLAELCELRVSDTRIAVLFGCSPSTIKRRRREAGLDKNHHDIDMDDLCAAIETVRSMGTGDVGERCLTGALNSIGVSVSRAKIRAAVRMLDPFPLSSRWHTALQRRTYYVPFVNSLWHVDGHHKLIRWRIVIHGCIDGKTRIVTFMKAHSDNKETSVTACFRTAVEKWGLPSRVRADFGGENLGIKRIMEEERGLGRASFIQGSSTHNQRIERLWVDLQRLTTAKYKAVFEHLEAQHLLDVSNPIHLWALHFIFIPQLNHALAFFADLWNFHPIRTQGLGNRSPMQLRAEGIIDARKKGFDVLGQRGIDDSQLHLDGLRNFADYGVEFAGHSRERRDTDPHVHIEAIDHLLPPALLDVRQQHLWREQLPQSWPPGEDFGITAYGMLLQLLAEHLSPQ
ncbi:hypothetical protein CF319_g9136 [Tilletia indica]|nr:hypothetical protein CF319_g9136 [Tilletia indica]